MDAFSAMIRVFLMLSLSVIAQSAGVLPSAAQGRTGTMPDDAVLPPGAYRCGTAALLSLAQHRMPSGARPLAGFAPTRPTRPGESVQTGGFGHTYTTTPVFYDSPGGHFRIWYVVSGTDRPGAGRLGNNDKDGNGLPDWVERTAEFFDRAWRAEIDTLAFRTPPVDFQFHAQYANRGGDDGGDARYDVYIEDISVGIAGFTNPESVVSGQRLPSYIVVDNDYAGIKNTTEEALDLLRVTAAHEFFHALQFGYDAGEDVYWLEQSAVWMEEQVFPEVNDFFSYLGTFNGFLSAPWLSLDTQNGQHEFSGVLWPLYLSRRFGPRIIRSVWEHAETVQSLDAMEMALQERSSSLRTAFRTFTAWNVFTGARNDPARYYEDGAAFPGVAGTDTTRVYPFSGPTAPLNRMPSHLGSNYLFFIPDRTRPGGLRINFSGLTGDWAVSVVGANITGPDTVITAPVSAQQATAEIFDWNRFDIIVLVVASLNRTGFNYQYQYTVEQDPTLVRQEAPGTVSLINFPNPFNGGTRIRYAVPMPGHVVIKIYNTLGQIVRTLVDQDRSAGQFDAIWDGSDSDGRKAASGVYFSRLVITGTNGAKTGAVQKMLLIK